MDTVFLALRVVVSLGAVFGALWFAHRWVTKGRPGTVRAKAIGVVARQGLGAKAGVAIVDAGGRRYLLGVTEHQVTVLDRLGAAEPETGTGISVVSTAPVPLPAPGETFERELARVTGTGPVVVSNLAGPAGPPTQTIKLPAPVQYQTRRAARDAENARATDVSRGSGPLAGSLLSPATWRQTAAALRRLR